MKCFSACLVAGAVLLASVASANAFFASATNVTPNTVTSVVAPINLSPGSNTLTFTPTGTTVVAHFSAKCAVTGVATPYIWVALKVNNGVLPLFTSDYTFCSANNTLALDSPEVHEFSVIVPVVPGQLNTIRILSKTSGAPFTGKLDNTSLVVAY